MGAQGKHNLEGDKADTFAANHQHHCLTELPAGIAALDIATAESCRILATTKRDLISITIHQASPYGCTETVTISLHPYPYQGNRFTSKFELDKLGTGSDVDIMAVEDRSSSSHGGHAVANANRYCWADERIDFACHKTPYRLPLSAVQRIRGNVAATPLSIPGLKAT
ncbi:hypothetical protein HOY80DRAFT_1004943 [Tuber brumale]|nr:hypothetical protein HOY80DRAFT_1004943 [Tuber brumale]